MSADAFRAEREMHFPLPTRCAQEVDFSGMRCRNKAEFIIFRISTGDAVHVCGACVGDAVRLGTRRGPVSVERMS